MNAGTLSEINENYKTHKDIFDLNTGGPIMNEENINIRWANTDDAADLVRLNDDFNGIGMTIEEVQDNLATSNELVALAVINGEPVGFACAQYFRSFCYRDLQGEITELFINEVARRRGLATLLIAFLEKELKSQGVSSVKVLTGKNNEIAIKTYERSKFSKKEEVLLKKIL